MPRLLSLFLAGVTAAAALAGPTLSTKGGSAGPASRLNSPGSSAPERGLGGTSYQPVIVDTVQIMAVKRLPSAVQAKTQSYQVRVRYALLSHPRGFLAVGFNVNHPNSFKLMKERWIDRGQGELEFTTEISPVDWKNVPLTAFASLSAEIRPKVTSALASHTAVANPR